MTPATDGAQRPTAIDPYGCGCMECITGEYVPLENASDEQLVDMLTGAIANNIGPVDLNFLRYDGGRWELLSFSVGMRHVDADTCGGLGERLRLLTPFDISG